jgi:two-component system chemotaxis response regulator CheB
MTRETTRVLIVDDSQLIRDVLAAMLDETPGFQVVGQARDGEEAVRLTARLRPDVITMDIRMPRKNGLEATREIMASTPTPIVVLATSIYDADMNIAFNAVAAGALNVVEKPRGLSEKDFEQVRDQLVLTLRLMADVQVVTILPKKDQGTAALQPPPAKFQTPEIIAIAASTGGPGILNQIFKALPGDFSIPIVLVQHITRGFAHGFAHWLNTNTALKVTVAQEGDPLAPGQVLVAPEGAHMIVTPGGRVKLDASPPINGIQPSATRLFDSVARTYKAAAVGVILSGMGDDGADGLEKLWDAGGHIIAQDQASCVVFGMPKVAIERGIVNEVLAPEAIAAALVQLHERRKASAG